jgi:carboxylesterase type B
MGADYAKTVKNLPPIATGAVSLINWMKDGTGAFVDGVRKFLHFIEDGVFDCPANSAAAARTKAGVPAWRYRYMGRFNDSLIGGQGAYHLSEVPIVMGTVSRKRGGASTEAENQLIKSTMTAWSSFAKDPTHGLEKLGWPKYDASAKTLVRLGTNNSANIEFVSPSTHDSNCKYLLWAPNT